MSWQEFNIYLLNGGSTVEALHCAVQDAFADIRNMNKPTLKARKVTLSLEFVPDDERLKVATKATVKTSFPAENPNIDMVQMSPDSNRGYLSTSEQLPIDFDPETGEVPMISQGARNDR